MSKSLVINKKINKFNKIIKIEGDKSLSIRCALLASQAEGKSTIKNLLKSDDVLSTIKCLKKLGIDIKQNRNTYEIKGLGLNGFKYKKNLTLDAGNSGTLGRLIMGLLVHSDKKIKIIGDESLSRRDFQRVMDPLQKFGAIFKSRFWKTANSYLLERKNLFQLNILKKKVLLNVRALLCLLHLIQKV
jgi:3-phosphoshikimate 1-carboxyvinyltransferase